MIFLRSVGLWDNSAVSQEKRERGGSGWGRAVPLQVRGEARIKCEGIWDLNRGLTLK